MPNTHMEINQLSSQEVRNENNSTTPSADQVCGLITPRGAAGAQTLPPLLRSNSTAHVDTTPVERADPVILLPSPARVRRSEVQTKLPNPPAHHITSHEGHTAPCHPDTCAAEEPCQGHRHRALGTWDKAPGGGTRLGGGGRAGGAGSKLRGCVWLCLQTTEKATCINRGMVAHGVARPLSAHREGQSITGQGHRAEISPWPQDRGCATPQCEGPGVLSVTGTG